MNAANDQASITQTSDFTRTWRYKVGFFMIVVGNLGILGAVLLGMVGLSAATVGSLVVGGEIVSLASIVFLGKEGFKAIKSKAVGFIKSSYTGPVSRTRHRIGITLLLANVVTTYLIMIYAWDAFAAATATNPTASVWGLNIEEQGSLVFDVFLIGEIGFLIGIYVMGGDWWEKFRNIFIWEAPQT